MTQSTLKDVQQQSGAIFDDGKPRHFGDPAAEYRAASDEAALFDVSDRSQIELTGGDRVRYLHNFCTNDIKKLRPGEGCEAFITNVKGRVLGHVFVFAAEDSLWLESVPGAEEPLISQLDRYLIREEVVLHGRSAECAELFVSGPRSVERLAAVGIEVSPLPPYGHARIIGWESPLFARRVDLLGEPDYLLSTPRERLVDLWNALAGAGLLPAGQEAFETLRIEAGMPWYGRDITEEQLAQEVGRTVQAISFTKGCYLGQEPIARIDALGHVNRELRSLRLASGPVPPPGTPVVAPDTGKEIGRITSSARSFADDRPVALAYLRSAFVAPGTTVTVQFGDSPIPATVERKTDA